MNKFIIFDTETTGLPQNHSAPWSDSDNWPRVVQLAWQVHDNTGLLIENHNYIIQPEGYDIPFNSAQIHGITTEIAKEKGVDLLGVLQKFLGALDAHTVLIGHNVQFDINVLGAELYRKSLDYEAFASYNQLDTQIIGTDYCQLPGGIGGGFKYPKLSELYQKLFDEDFSEAHNAAADVNATARAFFELIREKQVSFHALHWNQADMDAFQQNFPTTVQSFDIEVGTQIAEKDSIAQQKTADDLAKKPEAVPGIDLSHFFHFHNHSYFSILTAKSRVDEIVRAAARMNMPAVGLTDHGNLMGAFNFIESVKKINQGRETPIIPILGCEVYISERYQTTKFTKENPDRRYTQVLLAKNRNGFQNLTQISSIGFLEGYYSGCARVDKNVIARHKEDLIATTGSLSSEIPHLILNVGEKQALEVFEWWHKEFGEDFYIELIDHNLPEEKHVNSVLLSWSEKYGVPVLAQNNTYYIEQSEAQAHDLLICIKDGEQQETPIGRGRGFRYGFPNDEFYFKSAEEMAARFAAYPQAIENFKDFIAKFEPYDLAGKIALPKFDIPEEFQDPEDEKDGGVRGENAYLRHLAYEGAKQRYDELTPEIVERLDFELDTIRNTGYPGYFLIVQDLTNQAKKMGISVGPGRGSAAGSLVAYVTGITKVDPIKYDLLFERFLNPDRVSLPDIDIDFDDKGRDAIIQWVVNKYGKEQVSQIITYGTMAGKSALKDAARVLNLPLFEAGRLANKIHVKLNKLFGADGDKVIASLNGDKQQDSREILQLAQANDLVADTIQNAKVIEGSIRNTGVHACGVIIAPRRIMDIVPVAVAKDSNLMVTQYDNSVVENAGLLKMDFLSLRNLSIIQDAINIVAKTKGVTLDPDNFPLDDPHTYDTIFKKGSTSGIFQFESDGMQSNLKLLKPDKLEDLIAMTALYRPGPMAYIPLFVQRKHGEEKIEYDLPEMESFLKETYGVTVYQEQVMLLSQHLGGFSKGEADVLRKAMGKKQKDTLAKMKDKFIQGAEERGYPTQKLEKIWKDWEAFAEYAFNKSHATCYALVSFQTAYLKAHHPAEYMAALLSNNMQNIKVVTQYMQECKHMEIPVLSPDVNESEYDFTVNQSGAIRFGLGAIKGVGQAAVEALIEERNRNGKFKDVFDLAERIDLRICNKRNWENLIYAGALDELDEYHRGQYFYTDPASNQTNLEKIIKYGQAVQNKSESSQLSLFDAADIQLENTKPHIAPCHPWPENQLQEREKEVVGIFLSSHPLSQFDYELEHFRSVTLQNFSQNQQSFIGKKVKLTGMLSKVEFRTSSKDGREFATVVLEDYTGEHSFSIFGDKFLKFKHLLQAHEVLCITLQITQNKFSQRIYTDVEDMQLLSEIMVKSIHKLTMWLNSSDISVDLAHQIQNIMGQNPGDVAMDLIVLYPDSQQDITLTAEKGVQLNSEMLRQLQKIENIRFRLN
ncbi:MAG: DNA polymerase III subunit alpha [Weeksellaceae bacterium]|nr:DNA polymerase III subunit alpha [Weeksellaceae bacterium]